MKHYIAHSATSVIISTIKICHMGEVRTNSAVHAVISFSHHSHKSRSNTPLHLIYRTNYITLLCETASKYKK